MTGNSCPAFREVQFLLPSLTRLPEPEPDEAARLPSGDSGQGRDMATMQGGSGYPRDMTGGSSLV